MKKFYVYRLFDIPEVTLYVGKGSSKRLQHQMRKRRCNGEILEWFDKEKDAFLAEIRWMATLNPTENIVPGGSGGTVRKQKKAKIFPWEREMQRVGSRRYTARELLKFDLRGHVSASEVDQIRQVADGPWC